MVKPTMNVRRDAILFETAVLVLVLAVGCAADADSRAASARQVAYYTCDAECQAQMRVDLEYLARNFPTRDESLQVRACTTAKTGYDEFPDLSHDSGPPSLTDVSGTSEPVHRIEEDMPFRLVEKVLVAVGQRKPLRERVTAALTECVFELGLEDKYYLPRHQDKFRPRNS